MIIILHCQYFNITALISKLYVHSWYLKIIDVSRHKETKMSADPSVSEYRCSLMNCEKKLKPQDFWFENTIV